MKECRKILAVVLCLFLVDFGGIFSDAYAARASLSPEIPSEAEYKSFVAASFIKPNFQRHSYIQEFTPSNQKNGPFIVHIRDLHCHYEAQLKIARILEELWKENQPNELLVLTEGADGFVDTNFFGSFPDRTIKTAAARNFMNLGKMTGPEYLSIARYGELPIRIQGVEDADLYIENLRVFREVMKQKEETDSFLNRMDEVIKQMKQKVFSKELLEFDQKEMEFQEGTIAFEEYARFLWGKTRNLKIESSNQTYPNFRLLTEVLEKQNEISLERVEEERNQVVESLSKKLTKDELAELIKKGIEFRLGKVSIDDHFRELERLIRQYLLDEGSSIETIYPNLAAYSSLIRLQSKIDHRTLLDEIGNLNEEMKKSLSQTKEEKEIQGLITEWQILKRMLNLEMTREDLSFYQEQKIFCNVEAVEKKLEEMSLKHGIQFPINHREDGKRVAQTFYQGERFYELALKRDGVMVAKALQALKSTGASPQSTDRKVVVLITGGFHSAGVTEILKNKKVGYVVMTPRLDENPDMSKYQDLMMDKRILISTVDGSSGLAQGSPSAVPAVHKQTAGGSAKRSPLTISFFSLFNQKLAGRFSKMRLQELVNFADDVLRLSSEKTIDPQVLKAWVGELSYKNLEDPAIKRLLEYVTATLKAEKSVTKRSSLVPEEVDKLMNSYSLLTAELTVEVLEDLAMHGQMDQAILENAKGQLEKRLIQIVQPTPALSDLSRDESETDFEESQGALTQKHIGSAAIKLEEIRDEAARIESRRPTLPEMTDAYALRSALKDWMRPRLDEELRKINLNATLLGWEQLNQVIDNLCRGSTKTKIRYNGKDYEVEIKLARGKLALLEVNAMTYRDENIIQIVLSQGHLDALPHEFIEALLLTRPENRSPPEDTKRFREHAVHTKVVLLEPLFDPMLQVELRKIDGKVKGRVLRELKEKMPHSLSKLVAGSVQAVRDIEAKQEIKGLDHQSAELAKDLARNIVLFATQKLKRFVNDDLRPLGEIEGRWIWIGREISAKFSDFGFLGEADFINYLGSILGEEIRLSLPKREEIVISYRYSSPSSPLRQLFEKGIDTKPSAQKQFLRRALRHEISSFSFRHEKEILKEKAEKSLVKNAQGKIVSEKDISELSESEVIFLIQPYLGEVEERFLKEDRDFNFQLQSLALINEAIFKLTKRNDLSRQVGPKNQEEWKKYFFEKLSGYEKDIQLNFLQALVDYLNNDLSEASLLRSLPIELMFELTRLTVRFDFWNNQSIAEFAEYIENAINRIRIVTGKPPVIIEVAAGYGDLSFGLSERFPEIRIIPTDSFADDEHLLPENQTGLYDSAIIQERGIQKLSIEDILSGEFRKKLDIAEDVGVIVIASHLPWKKGVEEGLLNQTQADEMFFVHTRRPEMNDRVSGDPDLLPNREVWDFYFWYPDSEIWFNGLIYQDRRDAVEFHALSRKTGQNDSPKGAVNIPKIDELLRFEEVSSTDFLNWIYSYIGFDLKFEDIKSILKKTTLSPQEYQQFLETLDIMIARSNDSKVIQNFVQAKIYFQKLRPVRSDLEQEIEKLIDLIQTKTEKTLGRRLTFQDERNIRETARMVKDVHKNQMRKDGKTPYFSHQLEVTRILMETFGVIDPVAIQISLLHDTREYQEELYGEIRVKLYEDVLKQNRDQSSVNLIRLGVRMLSKLEGEKFASFSSAESEREYFRRLIDPKSVYSKDQDPQYRDFPWYSAYDGEFIHRVQLIKLSDRLANIGDLTNLFSGNVEITEKIENFPRKIFDKTLNVFIPALIFNEESRLTAEEQNIFLNTFRDELEKYAEDTSQIMKPLSDAAQEARNSLEGIRESYIETGAVKTDGSSPSNVVLQTHDESTNLAVEQMFSTLLEEKITLEELDQFIEALKNRWYLDGRATKVVGISQTIARRHKIFTKNDQLNFLQEVQEKMMRIRSNSPTRPVPAHTDFRGAAPTVRPPNRIEDETPFEYISRSVRKFMPFEDVGREALPGSASKLLMTPMLSRSKTRAKIIQFLRNYVGVRRDWEMAVIDRILVMRNFAHAITTVVGEPRVYQIGLRTTSEETASRINLISPLLETDFSQLIVVDRNPLAFKDFQERVEAHLKDVIDEGTMIEFPKDEQRENEQRYTVQFYSGGKRRTVIFYFNFDGMEQYPPEIEKGYDVLIKEDEVGEPKFYEKLFALLKNESGFIVGHGNDLTTTKTEDYPDREKDAYLNTINLLYPLTELPYLLQNFSEITSKPFFELARSAYRQDRALENGFMEPRPVLLVKNNAVKILKKLSSAEEFKPAIALKPPASSLYFQSFTRSNLDELFKRLDYQPEDLIEFIKGRNESLRERYEDQAIQGGLSLEKRNVMTMKQFERYFGYQDLPGQVDRNLFQFLLAIYDIEKPVDKIRSLLDTPNTIRDLMMRLKFDQAEVNLALSLAEADPIGEFLKTDKVKTGGDLKDVTGTVENAVLKIKKMAEKANMPLDQFFDLLSIYYLSHAGSYTSDAGGNPLLDYLFEFDHKNWKMSFAKPYRNRFELLKAGISLVAESKVTETLTEVANTKETKVENISLKPGINLFSLKLTYPAILSSVSIRGGKFNPEKDFQVSLIDQESFVKLIKRLFSLQNNLEAEAKARQLFLKAFQGLTFTTKRTGNYQIIEKDGTRRIVEIVDVEGLKELYERLEKDLIEKAGKQVSIPRTPTFIALYKFEIHRRIKPDSDYPEIVMELTDEERESIDEFIEARKPISMVPARSKAENTVVTSGIFSKGGTVQPMDKVASSDDDSDPDGGTMGKWHVTSYRMPKDGKMTMSLKGIGSNLGKTVSDKELEVKRVPADISARTFIIDLRLMFIQANDAGVPEVMLDHMEKIIEYLEKLLDEGRVYLIEDEEYFKGYGGRDVILLNRRLFESRENAYVALFHEAGESYFADWKNKKGIPLGLTPHTWLRGLGKGVRVGMRDMTDTEKNLPEIDGKKVGLQDVLFGFDRNILTSHIRKLKPPSEEPPILTIHSSIPASGEAAHLNWFNIEQEEDVPMTWRWKSWGKIDELKEAVKRESVFLGQFGGKNVWMDRELLAQYENLGFMKRSDFEKNLKEVLAGQFEFSTPGKGAEEIMIALLTDADRSIEDHEGNGFVGVNIQIFNHPGLTTQLKKKLLRIGLAHGLMHEFGIGNSEKEEMILIQEDIRFAAELGISTIELKKIDLFEAPSFQSFIRKLQQEYARLILERAQELRLSLDKEIDNVVFYLLQVMSEGADIEKIKEMKNQLEIALRDVVSDMDNLGKTKGKASHPELERIERMLAPHVKLSLSNFSIPSTAPEHYDVGKIFRLNYEYADFYRFRDVLVYETSGLSERIERKNEMVDPKEELERMRYEFLKDLIEESLREIEVILTRSPISSSPIVIPSKAQTLGGKSIGGEFKTTFTGDVWIEAGSFAYKVWIEFDPQDITTYGLKRYGHALINFQRFNKKKGQEIDSVYHPQHGEYFSVGTNSDNQYYAHDPLLSGVHFSVRVLHQDPLGRHTLEVIDHASRRGTTVEWKPSPELIYPRAISRRLATSNRSVLTPIVGISPNEVRADEDDINIADIGMEAPEHSKVNKVIRKAAVEGRLRHFVTIEEKKVFVVEGASALYEEQTAHAGIELNSIYIAEGAFNYKLARHEAIELQLWQEKAYELAGLPKNTEWESLTSEVRRNLKIKLRGWMRENFDEAQRLEAEFHESANRLALIPLGTKELIKDSQSARDDENRQTTGKISRATSRTDLHVVLQDVRAHVRTFAKDSSLPSKLLPRVSRYLEESVLLSLPPTDRPRAIQAAVGELHQVIGRNPVPKILGLTESHIPHDLKDKIIHGLVQKGYLEADILSLWHQLDDMIGPAWIDLKGKNRGSLAWVRLVVGMMEEAGLLKSHDHSKNIERMSRTMLFHGYAHQMIRPGLSENEKSELMGRFKDFLIKFDEQFGTQDIEEVLAQFVSSQFTGENSDLFDEVALDLESFLSGEMFPMIRLPRDEETQDRISQEIQETQPALLRIYQFDLKRVLIDYRNSLIRKTGIERFNDNTREILDRYLEIRRSDPDLKMEMGGWSLWDLFEDVDVKIEADLKKISDQVQVEVQDAQAKKIDGEVIGRMVRWGSGIMEAWNGVISKGILKFKGTREGPRIYVLSVESEGELTGLEAAYDQMRQIDPQSQMVLNSALDEEKIRKWLKVQRLSEDLLGRRIHVMDLTQETTIKGIFDRVSHLVNTGGFQIDQDLILMIPDHPETRYKDFRPYEFKIVVGKLGEKTHLIPDAMGLALVLGSVDWAYKNGQMNPDLREKLKNFLLEVAKEYFDDEVQQDEEMKKILVEIETTGYFKIPTWTNNFNDMMRRFVIQETYIAAAA